MDSHHHFANMGVPGLLGYKPSSASSANQAVGRKRAKIVRYFMLFFGTMAGRDEISGLN
jgi:hypothetical protein